MKKGKTNLDTTQFKPGDLIRHKEDIRYTYIVTTVDEEKISAVRTINIKNIRQWEKLPESSQEVDFLDDTLDNLMTPNMDKPNDLAYQLHEGPYNNYYYDSRQPIVYFHIWIEIESGKALKFAKYKFSNGAYFFIGFDDLNFH